MNRQVGMRHGSAGDGATEDMSGQMQASPASPLTQENLARALNPLIKQVTAHNAKMDARAAALEDLLEELVKQRSVENVISDVEKVIAPYIEEIERLTHENRLLKKRLGRRSWWRR